MEDDGQLMQRIEKQGKNTKTANGNKVCKEEKERTREVKNLAYSTYTDDAPPEDTDNTEKPGSSQRATAPGAKRYNNLTAKVR